MAQIARQLELYDRGGESASSQMERSLSGRIATYALLFGAFTLWTSYGIDVGFQLLTPAQGTAVVAFLAALHQLSMFPRLVPRETRSLVSPLLLTSGAMLLVVTASMVNAEEPVDTIRFYGRWVYGLMFLLAAIVICRGSSRTTKKLIMAFLLGGAATAVVCAVGYVFPAVGAFVLQDVWNKRAMGFLTHPNQLAMLYTGAVMLSFWPGLAPLRVRVPITLLLLLGLLLTGSKFNMGLTALLVPMLLFWLPAREGRMAQASASVFFGVPMVALAVVAGAYLIRANNQNYYERLATFVDDPTGASTTTSRFDLWSSSLQCTLESPLFGIGAGNADECLPFVHAHNVFINYMLETGFVGLVVLCAFFGVCIWIIVSASERARRLPGTYLGKNDGYRAAALLMIAIIAFILSNCSSDSMGPATMPTLWFYLALSLTLNSNVALRLRTPRTRAGNLAI
jgi:O-antigen ligase